MNALITLTPKANGDQQMGLFQPGFNNDRWAETRRKIIQQIRSIKEVEPFAWNPFRIDSTKKNTSTKYMNLQNCKRHDKGEMYEEVF